MCKCLTIALYAVGTTITVYTLYQIRNLYVKKDNE